MIDSKGNIMRLKMGQYVAAAALASMGLPTMANAGNGTETDTLSYSNAIRCASFYSMVVGIKKDGPPKEYKAFFELAHRWLRMASVRDGEKGKKARRELKGSTTAIINKTASLVDEPEKGSAYIASTYKECKGLARVHADEFDNISL